VIQGLKGLLRRSQDASIPRRAFVNGLFGGVLGGLFGSGGFVYAAYLERALENRSAFRATQAVLIALSTAWRIMLCFSLGLLDLELLSTVLLLLPAMAIGVYICHHIDLRMSREQLSKLLNCLLVASGMSLIIRFVW
jgi:uncharacterized membrane protein YfcA